MKKEVLNMPLGKFAGVKYSLPPYDFIREICGVSISYEKKDDVYVKDIINLDPKDIVSKLSESNEVRSDLKRNTLKTLRTIRQKLLEAGFLEKNFLFLKSPYFVTANSPSEEWEKLWIGNYGLSEKESKKLTELLTKVKLSVPQTWNILF